MFDPAKKVIGSHQQEPGMTPESASLSPTTRARHRADDFADLLTRVHAEVWTVHYSNIGFHQFGNLRTLDTVV